MRAHRQDSWTSDGPTKRLPRARSPPPHAPPRMMGGLLPVQGQPRSPCGCSTTTAPASASSSAIQNTTPPVTTTTSSVQRLRPLVQATATMTYNCSSWTTTQPTDPNVGSPSANSTSCSSSRSPRSKLSQKRENDLLTLTPPPCVRLYTIIYSKFYLLNYVL
jgi:hypothetical protein